jgi:hypothetical protein
MRNFALVIGVDGYKNPEWNLASATRDAIDFADWTINVGKVDPADLQLLLTPIGNTLSNPLKRLFRWPWLLGTGQCPSRPSRANSHSKRRRRPND